MNAMYIDMSIAVVLWAIMAWRFASVVRPRWKVAGKAVFYLGISFLLARMVGHWSLIFVVGHQLIGLIGHLIICRTHDINWWTCEPRERYIALQTAWAEKLIASRSKD